MQTVRNKWPLWMAATVALILVLDRISKWWTLASLPQRGRAGIEPIPGLLRFTYVENRGVAFGLFQNNSALFALLSTIIIVGILWRAWSWLGHTSTIARISVALIVAGGIGNVIDRLLYGFVVDFIHIIPLPIFQVFNVADTAISLGAVLLFFTLWREDVRARRTTASEASHG